MIDLKYIDEILYGKDGVVHNRVDPLNDKYWQKKWNLSNQKFDKLLEYKDKKIAFELFAESNTNFLFHEMFKIATGEVDIFLIQINNRVRYFKSCIANSCTLTLKNISVEVRTNSSISVQEILTRIRWYIFEANSLINTYTYSFEEVISIEHNDWPSKNDLLSAVNYLTCIYLRDCLIILHNKISIINGNCLKDDQYLDSFKVNKKKTESLYTLFQKHIEAKIGERDVDQLSILYNNLKRLIIEIQKTDSVSTWYEKPLLNDILKIEDILFISSQLPTMIGEEKIPALTQSNEDLFEAIYSEVTNTVQQETLPNSRLFLIERFINKIVTLLSDQYESRTKFLDSIPRKLVNRLKIDYETIKANPQINMTEFDRNSIKPIQTTISVSHLALLFKLLEEHSIIKPEQRNQLYKTVTKSFASKSLTGTTISEKSFQNNFNDPDKGSYKFWQTKFEAFYKECRKII